MWERVCMFKIKLDIKGRECFLPPPLVGRNVDRELSEIESKLGVRLD